MISKEDHEKIRKKYEKICIHKEIDKNYINISPFEAYARIRKPYSFLLESAEFDKTSKFSFLGVSREQVSLKNKSVEALKKFVRKKTYFDKNISRFVGGIVGFVSYDMVRQFERLPKLTSENSIPDALFLVTDDCIVFDHKLKKTYIIVTLDNHESYQNGKERIDLLEERLKENKSLKTFKSYKEFHSNISKKDFEEMVRKAKEYIYAGDIFQVVLSRKIEVDAEVDPLLIYKTLRRINPSPYMYFLDFENLFIIGSSPEVLVRLEGNRALVRPIAGTKGRGKTPKEDELLEREMLSDEKERAEHVMLLDLGRNDLGRVCEFGSVKVDEFMTVEKYSHVQHLVSSVSGKLKEGLDAFDLFRATFPAGTVSGAPKIRAMEIIEELEKERRGPYAGGVGYFSYNGNMDFAITIRTLIVNENKITAQGGAGIVADSDPEFEYYETEKKLEALREAVQEALK
ncbi:MAG: anthranilate synthase component I [Candidatus Methanofastidiosia archaeon]